jgi:hypothetical protein
MGVMNGNLTLPDMRAPGSAARVVKAVGSRRSNRTNESAAGSRFQNGLNALKEPDSADMHFRKSQVRISGVK